VRHRCPSSPPTRPAQCFHAAIEAVRIALKYRTPVILLSDGYLANGSEPWNLPSVDSLPDISVPFTTEAEPRRRRGQRGLLAVPARRDHARSPWAIPGTPGLMHRVGGLEKKDGTGNIDYTPENHERMVHLRADKIAAIAADIPPTEINGDPDADVLVLGWGSTWAAIDASIQRSRRAGKKVASAHIMHLNPLPPDLGDILKRFDRVIVPELNMGQLTALIRSKYLVDAQLPEQGAGHALQVTRDRSRHRRGARSIANSTDNSNGAAS
jgi:2-oxoglutarate/2-oxoacid ferredoxin oxidoreductase subunit alpha